MANVLKGKDVAASINEKSRQRVIELKEKGIKTTLAVLRVGEKENDLSYERNVEKKCTELGIKVKKVVLSEDVDSDEFFRELNKLNRSRKIHGILMFRPLPRQIDNDKARNAIDPLKDIDGCTDLSLAAVFSNTRNGFAPCTAEAVVRILDFYNIEITGKNVCVLGRSLVIGKPVSQLLLNRNATVTTCHTKTKDVARISSRADIVVCATGQMESLGKEYFRKGQTVIDVGLNFNEAKGKLCGDVKYDEVLPIVKNITPVPGGVGSVTTSVLISHIVESAAR